MRRLRLAPTLSVVPQTDVCGWRSGAGAFDDVHHVDRGHNTGQRPSKRARGCVGRACSTARFHGIDHRASDI
jgi:hypothetical protein